MRIELRKMTEAEFLEYMKTALPAYAREKQRGEGLTEEHANTVARESFAKLLPEGIASKDNFLFTVLESENKSPIGILWFAQKTDGAKPHAWVYDIELIKEVRGRGYGRLLMELLETEVRKLGLASISLHVFGHNTTAAHLYEKCGFQTTNKIMKKDLAVARAK